MAWVHARRGMALALVLSSFGVACRDREDSAERALEREALEQDLRLAVPGDSAAPAADTAAVPPAPAPAPTVAPTPAPTPAVRAPAPASAPRRTAAATRRPSRSSAEGTARREGKAPATRLRVVPAGARLAVRLEETLSTRTMGAGDTFTATVVEPVYATDGSLAIPAGATVVGRVVEARAATRAGERATLVVDFTGVRVDGQTYPLDAAATDLPVRLVTRDSKASQAAKVAGGAAAGALLGRLIGKSTKSTVAGAVIGAAAGTAVAIGTADVDAVAPAGTQVVLTLRSSLAIRR